MRSKTDFGEVIKVLVVVVFVTFCKVDIAEVEFIDSVSNIVFVDEVELVITTIVSIPSQVMFPLE